jgi:thymidylate kinase
MKTYDLICITGPDGSGKSTLIRHLQKVLGSSAIASIWDLMSDPALRDYVPFKEPQQVQDYLARLQPESRSMFLCHCLYESLNIAKKKKLRYILTDGYWYKYYATEKALGASPSYLEQLVSIFEAPSYLFYLHASETLTSNRKTSYSAYECGFAEELNKESFETFQAKSIENLRRLLAVRNPIYLDAVRSVEQNLETILHHLQPVIV